MNARKALDLGFIDEIIHAGGADPEPGDTVQDGFEFGRRPYLQAVTNRISIATADEHVPDPEPAPEPEDNAVTAEDLYARLRAIKDNF